MGGYPLLRLSEEQFPSLEAAPLRRPAPSLISGEIQFRILWWPPRKEDSVGESLADQAETQGEGHSDSTYRLNGRLF